MKLHISYLNSKVRTHVTMFLNIFKINLQTTAHIKGFDECTYCNRFCNNF